MKRILSFLAATALVVGLSSVAVSAHSFTHSDTNVETRFYRDGSYIGSEFSWGGNDHPAAYVYEKETLAPGIYHEGYIPKVNVEKRGPYGTIEPEGTSTTVTYYDATYHGWIDCSYVGTVVAQSGEDA